MPLAVTGQTNLEDIFSTLSVAIIDSLTTDLGPRAIGLTNLVIDFQFRVVQCKSAEIKCISTNSFILLDFLRTHSNTAINNK